MTVRQWIISLFVDKSILAYRAIAQQPDTDPGLRYPDDWPIAELRGKLRLTRRTRPGYDVPDRARLQILKQKADVIRMADRRRG
jgi:hypothetical protein